MIQLAFDRYLDPTTVTRQSFQLRDETGLAVLIPLVTYDPVARVVTISSPNPAGADWVVPGQPYKLVFPVPQDAGDIFGVRAIDGAVLDPSTPEAIGFLATAATGRKPPPSVDFCTDVLPLLRSACATAGCHSSPGAGQPASAPEGLVLDTAAGVQATALGLAGHLVSDGARIGPGRTTGVFPSDMPIVDPYNPGDSFLLYKLLIGPVGGPARDTSPCNASFGSFDYGPTAPVSAEETARLGDLVPGMPMPHANGDATNTPLGQDELERVELWIAEGAKTTCAKTCP